jgi:hypothetical protein
MVFLSLKTWLKKWKFSKPGCSTYTYFMIKSFRNAFLTFIWKSI